jgi:hypothetical protein
MRAERNVMPKRGLEPLLPDEWELAPQASVSANSTTSAYHRQSAAYFFCSEPVVAAGF